MSAKLLEARVIAEKIKAEIRNDIQKLKRPPLLASIIIGENPAATTYVKSQAKNAQDLGINYQLHNLESTVSEEELIIFIQKLNQDKSVNGIILQMPLPSHIDYKKISQFISPSKDVEGVHPQNMGKIIFGQAKILPCTAAAVMELLFATGLDFYGKEAVVVGHSEIVGKPLALLLLDKFATVTVCHIGTSQAGNLEEHIKRAEILVVAVGKAGLIKGEWIKEGAVVIDVGINKIAGKIVGDVEFETAYQRASYITPVPGGVGPLTVTMLLRNLVQATMTQQ